MEYFRFRYCSRRGPFNERPQTTVSFTTPHLFCMFNDYLNVHSASFVFQDFQNFTGFGPAMAAILGVR